MEQDPFKNQEQLAIRAEIATEKDLEEVKTLRLEAVQESPKSFDEKPGDILERTDKQWKDIIFGDKEFVVLGKKGFETMGMLSAAKDKRLVYKQAEKLVKNVWYIRWGYLKPEFRKKAAGFAIKGLGECLEEIRRRGGEAAVLMVLAENENKESIIKIGKKFGFEVIEGILRSGSVFMRLELKK